MAYNSIPPLLQYLMSKQGRKDLTPEEQYLMGTAEAQQASSPAETIQLAQGPNPAEVFARSPGSVANQIMMRRNQANQITPEDVLPPQTPPQGNAPARTTIRGASTPTQQNQLIMLLMKRGMTKEQAEAAAAGL